MISKKVRTLETTLQKYRKFSKYKQLQLSFFIAMANKKFQLIRTFYNFFLSFTPQKVKIGCTKSYRYSLYRIGSPRGLNKIIFTICD